MSDRRLQNDAACREQGLNNPCLVVFVNSFFWRKGLKQLEERILKDGQVLPGNIVKVGSFLNHCVDVSLLLDMGEEVKSLYADEKITKILTVEASGIAIATAFAVCMGVPVVFAKKYHSMNISDNVYTAKVHSFTHDKDYNICIEREYLSKDDCVLIVDDFLANGEALKGLLKITECAGAQVAGCAIAIEKGFQKGGRELRDKGVRIESLAVIDSIDDGIIKFRA